MVILALCCICTLYGASCTYWSTFNDNGLDIQGLFQSERVEYDEDTAPADYMANDVQYLQEDTQHVKQVSNGHDSHNNASHLHGPGRHNRTDGSYEHHGVHVASWHWTYVREPLVFCIFLLIVALCKLGFHHAHFLSSILPESCLLIVLGIIVGAIIRVTGIQTEFLTMSPRMFFLFILPPIILESAYSLHDRAFMDNLGTILIYAVLGTLVSCFIIGSCLYALSHTVIMSRLHISLIECFVFSSLIVAVDPVAVLAIFQEVGVNNVLYFLVFGESLLNDAVTVVIYNMMKTFYEMDEIPMSQIGMGIASFLTVSLGGLAIGLLFGILTAVFTKYTKQVKVMEPLVVIIMAYASYIMAELFHFSGIISIIGCGLLQVHYAFHNIGYKSEVTVMYFTKMVSSSNDALIFLFLGFAVVAANHVWHPMFIIWSCILCFITRFAVVYLFTFIANKTYRLRKIDLEEQFIMAYGGLRGAVSFSLVNLLDGNKFAKRNMFETTTLVVILFTVFIQGVTIKPLVRLLRIKKADTEKNHSILQEINMHVNDHILAGIEEISSMKGRNAARQWLESLDSNYFRKWFQRNPVSKDDIIIQAFIDMQMSDHYKDLRDPKSGKRSESQWHYRDQYLGRGNTMLGDLVLESRDRSASKLSQYSNTSDKWKHIVGNMKRKGTGSLSEGNGNVEDPSKAHETSRASIHNWLAIAKATKNNNRRHDRNLAHHSEDLWSKLHEKHKRQSRLRQSMMSDHSESEGDELAPLQPSYVQALRRPPSRQNSNEPELPLLDEKTQETII